MSKLSPNFDDLEFTRSRTATKLGIDNSIPSTLLPNAVKLAYVLERVRTVVGGPIVISSGYRSPELNTAVRGSSKSAHCHALAADFHTPVMDCKLLAKMIRGSDIVFDQLIYEGTWVHLGLAKGRSKPRQEILTAVFTPGKKTRYVSGIV